MPLGYEAVFKLITISKVIKLIVRNFTTKIFGVTLKSVTEKISQILFTRDIPDSLLSAVAECILAIQS